MHRHGPWRFAPKKVRATLGMLVTLGSGGSVAHAQRVSTVFDGSLASGSRNITVRSKSYCKVTVEARLGDSIPANCPMVFRISTRHGESMVLNVRRQAAALRYQISGPHGADIAETVSLSVDTVCPNHRAYVKVSCQDPGNFGAKAPSFNPRTQCLTWGYGVTGSSSTEVDFLGNYVTCDMHFGWDNPRGGILYGQPFAERTLACNHGGQSQTWTMRGMDIPIRPNGATYWVTTIDRNDCAPEFNELDNIVATPIPSVFKVEIVPWVMHNIGWSVPEALQWKWFNSPAHYKTTKGFDWSLQKDITTVSMDWILDPSVAPDGRAIAAFNRLFDPADPSFFWTPNARNCLRNYLIDQFRNERTNCINFGKIPLRAGHEYEFHVQQIQKVSVPEGDRLDPLMGALGEFAFFATPKGVAVKDKSGQIRVEIRSVGIHAGDTFDFQDSQYHIPQYLGSWGFPDRLWYIPTDSSDYSIWNSDYRAYRAATGRGGDIMILTDERVVHLPTPLRYIFRR